MAPRLLLTGLFCDEEIRDACIRGFNENQIKNERNGGEGGGRHGETGGQKRRAVPPSLVYCLFLQTQRAHPASIVNENTLHTKEEEDEVEEQESAHDWEQHV